MKKKLKVHIVMEREEIVDPPYHEHVVVCSFFNKRKAIKFMKDNNLVGYVRTLDVK